MESTGGGRFPYRLTILQGEEVILQLRVQERWPGPQGQIFCMREEMREWPPPLEEVERVPVISLRRYGKRLSVVLDRGTNKRCDFLFLKKRYKNREGEYEQIFWRTQRALQERRPKVRLTARGDLFMHILIDTNERYPWRFSGCKTSRERLPAGDYALKGEEELLAVIERKTLDNFLGELNNMAVLHQKLGELESFRYSALVIEAPYADLLNPRKVAPWRPSFVAKAIGEIFALHPSLHIVFVENRKIAQEWALRFFAALRSHEKDEPHPSVREAVARYSPLPFEGGGYYEARRKIQEMPSSFTFAMLKAASPGISEGTLKKALNDLRREGKLTCHPRGAKSYWEKLP